MYECSQIEKCRRRYKPGKSIKKLRGSFSFPAHHSCSAQYIFLEFFGPSAFSARSHLDSQSPTIYSRQAFLSLAIMSLEEKLAKVKSPNLQSQQHVSLTTICQGSAATSSIELTSIPDERGAHFDRRHSQRAAHKFHANCIFRCSSLPFATGVLRSNRRLQHRASHLNRLST
jgi:hypothetical protein